MLTYLFYIYNILLYGSIFDTFKYLVSPVWFIILTLIQPKYAIPFMFFLHVEF